MSIVKPAQSLSLALHIMLTVLYVSHDQSSAGKDTVLETSIRECSMTVTVVDIVQWISN